MWSGERLTKIQTTTRPDHVWPEVWTKIGEAAQNREKPEWAKEKPKLDNARRLRGIYFIDPDDQDSKETLKKCEKKTGKTYGTRHALQKKSHKWHHESVCTIGDCIREGPKKRFMVEGWHLMIPQGNEWNLLSLKIMKTTLQAEDVIG